MTEPSSKSDCELSMSHETTDGLSAMKRVLVLNGSARGGGNTSKLVDRLCSHGPEGSWRIIWLRALEMRDFDYDMVEQDDDAFRETVRTLIDCDHVVFATPVYWYTMSGSMKRFFDRLTDLLMDPKAKPMGRVLVGKRVSMIATGADAALPSGFTEPFELTARYFDMIWSGHLYVRAPKSGAFSASRLTELDRFARQVMG